MGGIDPNCPSCQDRANKNSSTRVRPPRWGPQLFRPRNAPAANVGHLRGRSRRGRGNARSASAMRRTMQYYATSYRGPTSYAGQL
jgi:hypothetical protein